MRTVAALLVVLGLCGCGSTLVHAHHLPPAAWDFSTGGPNGAGCEVAYHEREAGTFATCLDYHYPRPESTAVSVTMHESGSVHICRGDKCLSNGGGPRLEFGHTVRVGTFRCTALHAGVRCITTDTDRGFLISADGVRRIG